MSTNKKAPFRKWYGYLKEIRSLLGKDVQISVFTATATNETKHQILEAVQIHNLNTFMIQKSPVKSNLSFFVQYAQNDLSLEKTFLRIIKEVKEKSIDAVRTLIFCQTRNQTAILWRMLEICLKSDFYHGEEVPQNRIVEMFHAGTPDSVKAHIIKNMGIGDSHLRILVCTIAFGMGIDCKGVYRIVHFGSSKTMENYLQECGRAGRDGQLSECFLIYNGFNSSWCSQDMKSYIYSTECRRKTLLKYFPTQKKQQSESDIPKGCKCCDICACDCKCAGCAAKSSAGDKDACNFIVKNESSNVQDVEKIRNLSESEQKLLKNKLDAYKGELLQEISMEKNHPNNVLLFSDFHIDQICNSCNKIFCMEDLLKYVEIWRQKDAEHILMLLNEVVGDVDAGHTDLSEDDNDASFDEVLDEDWAAIRDDSLMGANQNISLLIDSFHSLSMVQDPDDDCSMTSLPLSCDESFTDLGLE